MSFGQTVHLMQSATLGKKQTANRQKHHKPPVKHGSEGVVVWAYFAATGPEHLQSFDCKVPVTGLVHLSLQYKFI